MVGKIVKRVIIDTDVVRINALSIALAAVDDQLDVKLLTTVAGRTSVEQATKNALKIITFLEKKIPVAIGANRSLVREVVSDEMIHTDESIDGEMLPQANYELLTKNHAVLEMNKVLVASKNKTTIISIGPLTNIALLLRLFPESVYHIEEIIILGNPLGLGMNNVLPEWTMAADPEAAKIVLTGKVKKTILGFKNQDQLRLVEKDGVQTKLVNQTGKILERLIKDYQEGSLETEINVYDAHAIAYASNSDIFELQSAYVTVETRGALTAGLTLVDLNGTLGEKPNCDICVSFDEEQFNHWALDSLGKCV